jgi:hypothetical protein
MDDPLLTGAVEAEREFKELVERLAEVTAVTPDDDLWVRVPPQREYRTVGRLVSVERATPRLYPEDTMVE